MLPKLIFIAALVALAVSTVSATDRNPTPQDILKKMAVVYSSCRSYKDTGTQTVVISSDARTKAKFPKLTDDTALITSFSTVFVRPDRLKFESSESDEISSKPTRYVFWAKGKEVHSWNTQEEEVRTSTSIHEALSAPAGTPGEPALSVLRMLMPKDIAGWAVSGLSETRLMDSKIIDGVNCFVIRGKTHAGTQGALCVDKKTYLVLKTYESSEQGHVRMETITTYQPQINVNIPADAFAFAPPVVVVAKESIPALEILKKTSAVYGSCKSYRDTGTVTTVMRGGFAHTDVESFSTDFVRPARFKSTYTSTFPNGKEDQGVVWSDGKETHSWGMSQEGKVVTEPSIGMALDQVAGVSLGSTHMMPRMLMPKYVGGWSITNLKDAHLAESEKVDGTYCFVIQGKAFEDLPMTLYIDEKTYLVLQIVTEMQIDKSTGLDLPVQIRSTTKYKPEMDANIPDDALTFTPPK